MKQLSRLVIILYCLVLTTPLTVHADNPSPLLIVEVQSRSSAATDSANQEFIELFNVSEDTLDLSLWKLEYKAATSATWTAKAQLEGLLYPNGRYLLASTSYLVESADQSFSPGLADAAGHVRLTQKNSLTDTFEIRDTLGWGSTANAPEGLPATELNAGKSLQRLLDEIGEYIDTDNNSTDFAINAVPTPESANPQPVVLPPTEPEPKETPDPEIPPAIDETPVEPPVVPPAEEESPAPVEEMPETPVVPVVLLGLQITELLPNPASPQTDNSDEFIELFNPNNVAVDLTGYTVKTGSNLSYSYALSGAIEPNGYIILTSGATPLSLANSTGKARLVAPDGSTAYETVAYEEAPEGQAWAFGGSGWAWTTTPTPAALNVVTAPVVEEPAPKTTASKTITKKATVTKTAATPKVKTASSTAKTASTTTKPKKATTAQVAAADTFEAEELPPAIHPLVLASVSAAALLYAAYEYRQDVSNRFYQLRLHRAARRAARTESKGR